MFLTRIKNALFGDLAGFGRKTQYFRTHSFDFEKDSHSSVPLVCGIPAVQRGAGYTVKHYDFDFLAFKTLKINHCEFFYHDIKVVQGVVVGELGSQVYQLNSKGVPISHGQFEEDFIPNHELLEVGESEYFEMNEQKTFPIFDGYYPIRMGFGQNRTVDLCRFKLGEGKSEFFGSESGAVFYLFNKNKKPITYEGKDLYVHELYLKDDQIIGTLGARKYLLNKDGKVLKTF